jgi:predicted DNA-binding protein
MQKMQILFPEPVLERLRALSQDLDRPVSELVRRAVDQMIERLPESKGEVKEFPVFHGGGVLVSAEDLKQVLYDE